MENNIKRMYCLAVRDSTEIKGSYRSYFIEITFTWDANYRSIYVPSRTKIIPQKEIMVLNRIGRKYD